MINEINFVDTDTNTIKEEVIAAYEALAGVTLSRADPIRLFLESLAAVIVRQRTWINYAAKMNLLYYSADDYLDHIGYLVGCSRIQPAAAITTMRATLSAARGYSITVPAGTRVTTADGVIFATDDDATIPAGSTTVDIPATCTAVGDDANGIAIGDICMIMDPIAYVQTIKNITVTEGGAAEEDDETFRERIRLAPEHFSVAGPSGAYEYHVKSVSSLITDVAVYGPPDHPGDVYIYALLEGGVLPGTELKQEIYDYLNTDSIRPLTDHVYVKDPAVVNYNIDLTYYIDNANKTQETAIRTAVGAAVQQFIRETKTKLGCDVNPSRLIQLMTNAGAKRINIVSPAFTAVASTSVAFVGTSTVNYGGLEDG